MEEQKCVLLIPFAFFSKLLLVSSKLWVEHICSNINVIGYCRDKFTDHKKHSEISAVTGLIAHIYSQSACIKCPATTFGDLFLDKTSPLWVSSYVGDLYIFQSLTLKVNNYFF
jgi:hypothetical protein